MRSDQLPRQLDCFLGHGISLKKRKFEDSFEAEENIPEPGSSSAQVNHHNVANSSGKVYKLLSEQKEITPKFFLLSGICVNRCLFCRKETCRGGLVSCQTILSYANKFNLNNKCMYCFLDKTKNGCVDMFINNQILKLRSQVDTQREQ